MIRIELPLRTVSEANLRGHWAKSAGRKAEHRRTAKAMLNVPIQRAWRGLRVLPLLHVVLTRIAPRPLDDDNLCSALKATRDGVADALGVNDRDPRVTWRYAQERGAPKQYAVRVQIEPEAG